METAGRWGLLGDGDYWEMGTTGRWGLPGDGDYREMGTTGRWRLLLHTQNASGGWPDIMSRTIFKGDVVC